MPEPSVFPVLTCPLCGRPDEAANMTAIAIPYAAKFWVQAQTLCQTCCLAVMDAVQRELDEYNQGVINDGDFHFGLVERGDPEPEPVRADAAENPEHQPDNEGPGEHRAEPGANGANRKRAKRENRAE